MQDEEKLSPPKRVPLPNGRWMRSPRLPDYAICLDAGPHHGWMMLEGHDDNWLPLKQLSRQELGDLLQRAVEMQHRNSIVMLMGSL